jgi:hypothetical protein
MVNSTTAAIVTSIALEQRQVAIANSKVAAPPACPPELGQGRAGARLHVHPSLEGGEARLPTHGGRDNMGGGSW